MSQLGSTSNSPSCLFTLQKQKFPTFLVQKFPAFWWGDLRGFSWVTGSGWWLRYFVPLPRCKVKRLDYISEVGRVGEAGKTWEKFLGDSLKDGEEWWKIMEKPGLIFRIRWYFHGNWHALRTDWFVFGIEATSHEASAVVRYQRNHQEASKLYKWIYSWFHQQRKPGRLFENYTWLVVWNHGFFLWLSMKSWEFHHPNWLSLHHFSEG